MNIERTSKGLSDTLFKGTELMEADRYEPNYDHGCCVCGQTPTVVVTRNGKPIHATGMCGPCSWGEADTINPENWNENN